MASPLKSGKQTVDLAAKDARVSKIRRDPPPVAKKALTIAERDDNDRRMAAIGIVAFAIAIVAVIIGAASYNGWSPSQHSVSIRIR